ncbi:MAG: AI-2E family transporter [Muribaculum sp.]|nr:AI-2E family transporter [Muribaculaceae bacterium]MCM1081722.1 AI-2E family transporter [Muribaculum sp.]
MREYKPFNLDRTVRLLISCAIAAAVIWLIYRLRSVLLPFCVAVFVAYLLEPFVQFNRRLLKLKGRVASIFITLFEATFFFGLLCYFCVPMITMEMSHMGTLLKQFSETELEIPMMPDGFHAFIKKYIDFDYLSRMTRSEDQMRMLENLLTSSWQVVTSGINMIIGLLSWFIVFLYVIFIMLDYDRLSASFKHMVPPAYRPFVLRVANDVKQSMNHYFRGQALVAFCVGVLFSIGFSIIDLPMAIVMGMFIGLLNMVPYLQLISIVPTLLLCLVCSVDSGVDFWVITGEAIAVYFVVQAIQDLYLTPKIMGKAMGLNPAIILLSLSIWGSLLGFLGLIIALPLTTLILAYYDQYLLLMQHRADNHKHSDVRSNKSK